MHPIPDTLPRLFPDRHGRATQEGAWVDAEVVEYLGIKKGARHRVRVGSGRRGAAAEAKSKAGAAAGAKGGSAGIGTGTGGGSGGGGAASAAVGVAAESAGGDAGGGEKADGVAGAAGAGAGAAAAASRRAEMLIDLNEANHSKLLFSTLAKYAEARKDYCQQLIAKCRVVTDEATGKELRVDEQRLFMQPSPLGSGMGVGGGA